MTARARAASIFQTIADAVDAGLAAPMFVNVFSPETGGWRSSTFAVRVPDNEVDQLAEWIGWLGAGAVQIGELHGAEAGVFWRSRTATGVWQGWRVEVWARVDEPADVVECTQCRTLVAPLMVGAGGRCAACCGTAPATARLARPEATT